MLSTTSMANPSWAPSMSSFIVSMTTDADFPSSIVVEFAKESRPRREVHEERSYGYDLCGNITFLPPNTIFDSAPRSRRPPGIRLIVSGVSRDTSWQVRDSPLSFLQVSWSHIGSRSHRLYGQRGYWLALWIPRTFLWPTDWLHPGWP